LSPRPRELKALPPVRKAWGPTAVFKYSIKLLQQQLASFQDRELTQAEREFLILSIKSLAALRKTKGAPEKDEDAPGSTSGGDPLKALRG